MKVGIIAVECLAQRSFSALVMGTAGIRREIITSVNAIEDKTHPSPPFRWAFFDVTIVVAVGRDG